MPRNRRPGRPTPTRRPKVAGLRNRENRTGTRPRAAQPDAAGGNGVPTAGGGAAADDVAAQPDAAGDVAGGPSDEAGGPSDESAAEEPSGEQTAPVPGVVGPGAGAGVAAWESGAAAQSPAVALAEQRAGDAEPVRQGSPWGLLVASVILTLLAVWFGAEAYFTRYTGPAANEALVSAGVTSEVNGQITDAVETLFSYDFTNTAKTENAARELLIGPAVQRYDELFAVVKQQAPQQQLIVTTTVNNSAVTRLQGDRAEVLLFVDQHALRATTGETNTGPAQLSVTAEKQGGRWKISQIILR
ncbi:hypothetical protein GCM10011581_33610 [Saccharopolyspora subtropica]|uniref:Mce-associated membrane protein n=1 Tax=Saccharopolyspora thermophila TaxID=89367 RepID=A0A917NE16_9PSEU|nr:hypothetical protein [Saccharopolyspora subtropica]GGI93751.1 hypothetical protein GCM10011581_33610 [Saccharopolyspora subtropica]